MDWEPSGERDQSWVFKNDDSATEYGSREKPHVIESALVCHKGDVRNPQEIWQAAPNWEDQVRDVIVRRWIAFVGIDNAPQNLVEKYCVGKFTEVQK